MFSKLFALTALVVLGLGLAEIPGDEIKSLPGWDAALPSRQFSGFLNASDTSRLHYWLVLADEVDPATAPVVIWFNGGPGCSSLDGYFYEHGPFSINSDYKTLSVRDARWNKQANTLYIESPVGVGFSYSTSKNYIVNDDRTANENRAAVENFYKNYPEFKNNKFFITGESYAGIYVPTLAEAILNGEKDGSYTGAKLTGIAVGNGCSGTEIGICGSGTDGTWSEWSYLTETSFIDLGLKKKVNAACNWTAAENAEPNALSSQCVSLLNQASAEIGHVNLYNIYGDCVSAGCASEVMRGKVPMRAEYISPEGPEGRRKLGRIIPHGPDACIDSAAASAYLTLPEVQEAIHVSGVLSGCWSVCGTTQGWKYTSTRPNLPRDTYPALVKAMHVTVYNGDWDACVPYTDGISWTQSLGLPIKKSWHAWTYTSLAGAANQVAGYATEYVTDGIGSFRFVTVKGGRHEVPVTAPGQATEMLNRILSVSEF